MTKLLDRLLGLILSIIEGIIIVYFVISMIFIPFINQGKETIEQTYIGSFIIDTMPHYFSSIADFKDLNQLTHLDVSLSDEKQVSMVTNFIEEASQNKWLDDETIKDFIYNYYSEIDLQTVDQEDYQRISSLCQNYDIDINLLTKGKKKKKRVIEHWSFHLFKIILKTIVLVKWLKSELIKYSLFKI